MAVDTQAVGIEATRLMDDMEEEGLPDDAQVEAVGLAVLVTYPDGTDNPVRHVMMRCSSAKRVEQVGLFETAKHIALTSGDED